MTFNTSETEHKTGPFFGWRVVWATVMANFMATGSGFYIFNAFMKPLCDSRNWSRTDLNAAAIIGYCFGLAANLWLGYLVEKAGPRRLMVAGTVITGIAFALMGTTQSIWVFYTFFILLVLGNSAMSGVVTNTAVSNWFVRKRGQAMGISTAGISLSGVILPYLAMVILTRTGIENAFFIIAGLILAVAPLCQILVKNRPEDFGQQPDGDPLPLENSAQRSREPDVSGAVQGDDGDAILWTLPRLLKSATFWKVGVAFGLMGMCIASVMFQLAPRFNDIGFDSRTAMAMMSFTALMGTLGKYAWGRFCDRFDPRKVVTVLMGAITVGLALAVWSHSLAALVLFILIFGFAMGGYMATFPIIVAELFGRAAFARVFKYAYLFLVLEVPGFLIMGQSFDLTGSYDAALGFYMITSTVAALLVFSIKSPAAAPPEILAAEQPAATPPAKGG